MASLTAAELERDSTKLAENNCFRRLLRQRWPRSGDFYVKHRVIGLYYIAVMLLLVNAISHWNLFNREHSLSYGGYDDHFFYPVVQNWTRADYVTFYYSSTGVQVCTQVPAALLIYLTSSHKFLTAAVAISSILHMLTPVAVNLDPRTLMTMLFAQLLVLAPLRIAVLSMWKDWALPAERMKFVFLSFSTMILSSPFTALMRKLPDLFAKEESFYISGACGLGWSLLWFFTVSGSPASNSRGPNYNQLRLQNNILSTVKGKPKISGVPWKSILTSKPVFALCLIYFKIGGSYSALLTMILLYAMRLHSFKYLDNIYFCIIFAVLNVVILFSSAIATDFFIRKYPRMINAKKSILCKMLIIHGLLLLGTLFHHIIPQVIFGCLSYFIFSISLAGFINNALDLSSQYVSIICGFIETFYLLGELLSVYYREYMFDYLTVWEVMNSPGKMFLYEVAVSTFVAVIFLVWGSFEEQPWSMNTVSRRCSANTEVLEMPEEHELGAVPIPK